MDFEERIVSLGKKLHQQKASIATEEATKIAIVMPFINNILGYDVFNPLEVIPEFTADIGTKKGEKVDYAIMSNGEVQILIEVKKIDEELSLKCASQLYRYFSVTPAKIAILTNGQVYRFYTDLDAPNRMDQKPFLEIDLLDINSNLLPELKKITKDNFNAESIITVAEELKYIRQFKTVISNEFKRLDDKLIKLLIHKVYEGSITQRIKEQFSPLIKKALSQWLSDIVNERLKLALSKQIANNVDEEELYLIKNSTSETAIHNQSSSLTHIDEIEGYSIVKAIIRNIVNGDRVIMRDTKSYCSIILDNNNRKPICRFHFNRSKKYIGIFDMHKRETKCPIENVDDIFRFESNLKKTAQTYLCTQLSK